MLVANRDVIKSRLPALARDITVRTLPESTKPKVSSNLSFQGTFRLKKSSDYDSVQARARRWQSKHFLILIAPAQTELSRLGIIITKKIDKRATRRNTLRRKIRECFRKNREKLTKAVDLVIIARRDSVGLLSKDLYEEILSLLAKAKAISDHAQDL